MDETVAGKIKLPPALQIGMVVKNLDKVMEFYSSAFGIGPWLRRDGETEAKAYDGKTYEYRVRTAFANLGPAQLELFQMVEGR